MAPLEAFTKDAVHQLEAVTIVESERELNSSYCSHFMQPADVRFGSRSVLHRLRNVLFSRWGRFLSSDRLRIGTPRTLRRDGALRPLSLPKSRRSRRRRRDARLRCA